MMMMIMMIMATMPIKVMIIEVESRGASFLGGQHCFVISVHNLIVMELSFKVLVMMIFTALA